MSRLIAVVCACFVFSSFSSPETVESVYTPPEPQAGPCPSTFDVTPLAVWEPPLEDEFHHQGFKGRWVEVCATAYTPTNAVDSDYHETKGKYRWKTADGRTDVRRTPYGIAVPLQRRSDKKITVWPFGTRVIIPTGYGYLDRSRTEERIFKVDDTSESSKFFYSKNGKLHIDVRFVDDADAFRWAGPKGYRFIKIFVIEE